MTIIVRVRVKLGCSGWGCGRTELGLGSGLEVGLEEVFEFDSTSENRDRAVEAVESVSEARAV